MSQQQAQLFEKPPPNVDYIPDFTVKTFDSKGKIVELAAFSRIIILVNNQKIVIEGNGEIKKS